MPATKNNSSATTAPRPALDALQWYIKSHVDSQKLEQVLFSRARHHSFIQFFSPQQITFEQTFVPYVHSLEKRGIATTQTIAPETFDLVLYPGSKSKNENLWYLAHCFRALKKNGRLLFVLENNLGASSYRQIFQKVELSFETESKNKCRIYSIEKASDAPSLEGWFNLAESKNSDGYYTHPAIFSWDHVDPASELLVSSLTDIKGVGADLGAGNGYLAAECKKKFPDIHHIDLFEAELHALEAARKNLKDYEHASYFWHDVQDGLPAAKYDWIVMNPPYHVERQHSVSLFTAFIEQSCRAICKTGSVFCVSQKSLPQKAILKEHFDEVEFISENQIFQCFRASQPMQAS